MIQQIYRTIAYKYLSWKDGWSFPATMAHSTGFKMVRHTYEPEVTALLQNLLKSGDHVLDVGANIGYFSKLALEFTAPDGIVVAAEMEPENFGCLRENITDCPPAHAVHCAVTDYCGTAAFYRSHHSSCHSLHDTHNLIDRRMKEQERVQCYTLDYLWREFFGGNALKLVKIDVEGAETDVLRGGEEAIEAGAIEHIIVEYCPAAMIKANQDTTLFFNTLRERFDVTLVECIDTDTLSAGKRLDMAGFDRITSVLLHQPGAVNCNFFGTLK